MPLARVNGISLGYDVHGRGDSTVVLVTGTGAPGRIWRTHQVPALVAAGHRVVTLDNRGIAPTDAGPGPFTLTDLAADVAALISWLGAGPCGVVGFSLGAMIVQELLLDRPELVTGAVLMATRGRTDALAAAMSAAEIELCDSGIRLPAKYAAYLHAMHSLSPRTLRDENSLRDWLDIFELSSVDLSSVRGQLGLEAIDNRLGAYGAIRCPTLVIAFADDRIVRPELCREVADSIPGSEFLELQGCGHYGNLERPDEVNSALVEFFGRQAMSATSGRAIAR
ncbi:alpha/beta fold hydrolase [Actinomadura macrotermitis]|uniref:Putative non-heme bromoperoxidase BpoC n=1 Tax=Actinomadura macrotermitis TaxID=2585200 RepID=A0A7K0BPK8_9ACTN|nr:putative non-heme bromoperoxidase BpoC [Actinomadura macrotermitis]